MSNNSTSKQSSNKITAGIISKILNEFFVSIWNVFVAIFYVLVIGDEILKGYTEDTNSRYLCRALFKQGIKVSKVGQKKEKF